MAECKVSLLDCSIPIRHCTNSGRLTGLIDPDFKLTQCILFYRVINRGATRFFPQERSRTHVIIPTKAHSSVFNVAFFPPPLSLLYVIYIRTYNRIQVLVLVSTLHGEKQEEVQEFELKLYMTS